MFQIIVLNTGVFISSLVASQTVLQRGLFSDQDLSQAKTNKYIFSLTFACCILMLLLFLQEVQQTFDPVTSQALWKSMFMFMTLLLLVVVPLALIKDFVCSKARSNSSKKSHGKSQMLVSCFCLFFIAIFLVDALIFDKYIERDVVSKGYYEILWHSV